MSTYQNYYEINTKDLATEDIERLRNAIKQLLIKQNECNDILEEIRNETKRIAKLEKTLCNKIIRYKNEIDSINKIINVSNDDRNKL